MATRVPLATTPGRRWPSTSLACRGHREPPCPQPEVAVPHCSCGLHSRDCADEAPPLRATCVFGTCVQRRAHVTSWRVKPDCGLWRSKDADPPGHPVKPGRIATWARPAVWGPGPVLKLRAPGPELGEAGGPPSSPVSTVAASTDGHLPGAVCLPSPCSRTDVPRKPGPAEPWPAHWP